MAENIKNEKNALLLSAMRAWYENVFTDYVENCTDNGKYRHASDSDKRKGSEISCPFCMGLTDDYVNSEDKIKVMIVGQEARGFRWWSKEFQGKDDIWDASAEDYGGWTPRGFQDWAVAFMESQIDRSEKYKKQNWPFWRLFRSLSGSKDVELCWDNVDKVYYGKGGDQDNEGNNKKQKDQGTLTYKAEAILSKPFDTGNGEPLSLLQREIKIADPDVIVFAVGPYYALSLDVALGISSDKDRDNMTESALSKKTSKVSDLFVADTPRPRPDSERCVVRNEKIQAAVDALFEHKEVATLWTYHPGYLRRKNIFDDAVTEIDRFLSDFKTKGRR